MKTEKEIKELREKLEKKEAIKSIALFDLTFDTSQIWANALKWVLEGK